jgi:hypothetical protein
MIATSTAATETAAIDAARDEARWCSRGGFAFLRANGLSWTLTGVLTWLLPRPAAALAIIWQGMVSMPLSFALERALRFPRLPRTNPLTPLLIQAASVQLPALPAVIIVYSLNPAYVPAAFAAIVGGHFLPYIWIQRSALYGALAGIVALVPFGLLVALGEGAFYWINLVVGATLVIFAFLVRAQAERELGAAGAAIHSKSRA